MHSLTLFGEVPRGKASTAGVIKELADSCELRYEKVLQSDPEEGYAGPLLEAPDGVYTLWQQDGWVMLIIQDEKIIVEGKLIRSKALRAGTKMLAQNHLEAFRAMLGGSTKLIHVYEEPGTGTRQFMFLWPEDKPPEVHPEAAHCKYLGSVDLDTGRIR